MGFGPGRRIAQAFVEIRPDARDFGSSLVGGINASLTAAEDQINTRIGRIATGAIVSASVASAEALSTSLREVVSLGAETGPIQQQLAGFAEGAQSIATEFGVLTNDVVPALYNALSAGVPSDNVFEFLETAQQAATAGVASVEESVAVLSASVNTFAAEGLDAAEASDLLFTAVQGGVTTFGELAASIGTVGPAAAAAGVEFREVTSAVSALTLAGIGTSEASTQLRALFNELQTSSTAVAGTFAELTGQSFREFTASGGDVIDALRLLNDSAAEAGLAIGDLFGSVEASTAATVLAGQNFAEFEDQLASAASSTGATAEAFEVLDGSLTANLNRLRAFGQVARQTFGQEFLPIAEQFAEVAVDLAPSVLELAEAFGGGLGTVLTGVAIPALRAVTPPLELLASIVSAIPEPVFAAAAAYRLLYRTFAASATTTAAVAGLNAISSALTRVSQSATIAGNATRAARLGDLATSASASATRLSTAATAATRFGNALPIVGAAAAIAIPALLSLRDSGREAEERLETFTETVAELGGTNVEGTIDSINAIKEELRELAGAAEDADEAFEGVIEQATAEAIAGELDSSIVDAIGISYRELARFAGSEFADQFAEVAREADYESLIDGTEISDVIARLPDDINPAIIALLELGQQAGLSTEDIRDLAQAVEAGSVAQQGFAEATQTEARNALLGASTAIEDLNEGWAAYSIGVAKAVTGTDDYVLALEIYEGVAGRATEGTSDLADAFAGDYFRAAQDAGGASSELDGALVGISKSADLARKSIEDLADTYREEFDIANDVEDATQEYIEGFQELEETFRRFNEDGDAANDAALRNLTIGTEAGNAARDAIQAQANDLLELIDLRREEGVGLAELNDQLDNGRQAILDNAEALGISADAAQEFLDNTLEFPEDITIPLFLDEQELIEFSELIKDLPEEQQVVIRADLQLSNDIQNFLANGGDVGALLAGTGVPLNANGSIVPGSSTGTLVRVGETGDDEVIINPSSSIDRQVQLATDSGLLDNLQRAGVLGGSGVTVNQTIQALSYDEQVLAQFAREAARDALEEVGVA